MISFSAIDFSKYDRRALKIALLSTIPGLGQLFNGRRDKALAFFVVNLANAIFAAALLGCRLPFLNYSPYYFPYFCNAWEPGSVPFSILQCLLLSYVVYAQYDAYKDACSLSTSSVAAKTAAGLSQAACGSYVVHLSAFLLIGLLIALRICPDIRPPEENQICVSFELNSSETEEQKAEGTDGKIGEESNIDNEAHLKDPLRDSVKASSASAEMNANEQETGDNKPAAEEKEAVASKEIISPYAKQSPQESSSNGASENAKKTTKTPVEETKTSQSSPANITSVNSEQSKQAASPNQVETQIEEIKPSDDRVLEAAKKIAQVPAAALAGGMSVRIDESSAQSEKSVSSAGGSSSASPSGSSASPSHSSSTVPAGAQGYAPTEWLGQLQQKLVPMNATNFSNIPAGGRPAMPNFSFRNGTPSPYVSLNTVSVPYPQGRGVTTNTLLTVPVTRTGLNQGAVASVEAATTSSAARANDGNGTAPSMLGFMDSNLSSDPAMRWLWSEMSGNLSKAIKAQPLNGEGTAIVNFTVDQRGRISSLNTSSPVTELQESLVQTLQNMPSSAPPAKQFSKIYFQVKASNLKTGTVVALEINSEPTTTSSESLNDFKYQVSLQTYLKGIKKAIYSSWRPPVQEGVKPVMIGFKVSTDGIVNDQHIVESSGDKNLDRAALNAALSVTQWSQPPAGTSEDLDVCMVLQKCKNCDAELKASESGVQNSPVGRRAAPSVIELSY